MAAFPRGARSTARALASPAALQSLAVFCAIASIRWALVHAFAVDMPWMDQWNGEGTDVVIPCLEGRFSAADAFKPHNEHRIVLTRLLCAALFALNGAWSPLLEAYAGALIPAATGAVFVACCRSLYGTRLSPALIAGVVACFALPLSILNLLSGFQSQMAFLVLFSLPALALAADHRWNGGRVLAALALAGLASLSISSGALTFATLAGIWMLRGWADRERRIHWGVAAVVAAIATGIAMRFLVVPVPQHAVLRADGPEDFLMAFTQYLAWPSGLGLLLIWGPAVLVGLLARLSTAAPTRQVVFPFAILAWVGLVIVSASFFRGADGAGPADRYHDLLAPAVLAGLCLPAALAHLPVRDPIGPRWAAVYQGLLVAILLHEGLAGLAGLGAEHQRLASCAANLNAALRPGADMERLIRTAEPTVTLPFIDPNLVLWFLRHEQAARLLPAAVRPSLLRAPAGAPTGPAAYPAVADSPSGVELGTYQGSDGWQGTVDAGEIAVPPGSLKLLIAGYVRLGELEVRLEELPSHRRSSIESPVPLGQGEQWREVFFDPAADTTAVRISLVDHSTTPGGWLAVGGMQVAGRLERWAPWLGSLANWCLAIGTVPLFTNLASLVRARR